MYFLVPPSVVAKAPTMPSGRTMTATGPPLFALIPYPVYACPSESSKTSTPAKSQSELGLLHSGRTSTRRRSSAPRPFNGSINARALSTGEEEVKTKATCLVGLMRSNSRVLYRKNLWWYPLRHANITLLVGALSKSNRDP